jgi:hypothetical protein
MVQPTTFAEIVDAADELTLDEQETLLNILRRRISERGRQQILADAEEACREHARGETRVATPEEIMKELLS